MAPPRRLAWLAVVASVLCVSGGVAWLASGEALRKLRPPEWHATLASELVADYQAASEEVRFVPISPSIIEAIKRDESARSGAMPDSIAPIFVVGDGNQLPILDPSGTPTSTPQAAATSTREDAANDATPGPTKTPANEAPTPKATHTAKPIDTPVRGNPTPEVTPGPPTPKPTVSIPPQPTPQPTPAQPTPQPTQAHPTPAGGGGNGGGGNGGGGNGGGGPP